MSTENHPEDIPEMSDADRARELRELEAAYDDYSAGPAPENDTAPGSTSEEVSQYDALNIAKSRAEEVGTVPDISKIDVDQPANQYERQVVLFERLGGSEVAEAVRERYSAMDKARLDGSESALPISEMTDKEQMMAHFEHNMRMLSHVGRDRGYLHDDTASLLIKPSHAAEQLSDGASLAGRNISRDTSAVYEPIGSAEQGNDMLNGVLDVIGAETIRDDVSTEGSGIRLYKGTFEGESVYIEEHISPVHVQANEIHTPQEPNFIRSARVVNLEIAQDAMAALSPEDKAMLAQAGLASQTSRLNRSNMSDAVELQMMGAVDKNLSGAAEHIATAFDETDRLTRYNSQITAASDNQSASHDIGPENNTLGQKWADINQQPLTEAAQDKGSRGDNVLASAPSSAGLAHKTGRADLTSIDDIFKIGGTLDKEYATLVSEETGAPLESAKTIVRKTIKAAQSERAEDQSTEVSEAQAEGPVDEAAAKRHLAATALRNYLEVERGALYESRGQFDRERVKDVATYILGKQVLLDNGKIGTVRGLTESNERIAVPDKIQPSTSDSNDYILQDGKVGTLRGIDPNGNRLLQVEGEEKPRRIPAKPVTN